MMALVEEGKIGTIITKDMSRIGRNYLEVGMYTEITFPQNDVRFIAINSGVDSANQQDNEFVPFVNIINEYYVWDGSKKVRTSLRLKGESGEHLTTIPPYGYVKDPDNSEHCVLCRKSTPIDRKDSLPLRVNFFVSAKMHHGNNQRHPSFTLQRITCISLYCETRR